MNGTKEKEKQKRVFIATRVDPELAQSIRMLAVVLQISQSHLISLALEKYVNDSVAFINQPAQEGSNDG